MVGEQAGSRVPACHSDRRSSGRGVLAGRIRDDGNGRLFERLSALAIEERDGSFAGFILLGVGMGFCFVPISIAALAGATSREAGLQSGLINTMQQIGGAVGLAILITVATTRTNHLLGSGVSQAEASTRGYSLAFWVGAGLALVGLAATLLLLKRDDLRVNAAEPQPVAVGEPA
jgi:hypothetical protein